MLNNFDESWPGYDVIACAVRAMTNVALRINELKRMHDRCTRTEELRALLMDCTGGGAAGAAGGDIAHFGELLLEVRPTPCTLFLGLKSYQSIRV